MNCVSHAVLYRMFFVEKAYIFYMFFEKGNTCNIAPRNCERRPSLKKLQHMSVPDCLGHDSLRGYLETWYCITTHSYYVPLVHVGTLMVFLNKCTPMQHHANCARWSDVYACQLET